MLLLYGSSFFFSFSVNAFNDVKACNSSSLTEVWELGLSRSEYEESPSLPHLLCETCVRTKVGRPFLTLGTSRSLEFKVRYRVNSLKLKIS